MSDHNLAEALRHIRNHTSVNSHQIEIIDEALAAHEAEQQAGECRACDTPRACQHDGCRRAEQQAGEAVARVRVTSVTPGRFDEIDVLRPLPQGEYLLFTHPRQPLSDEQIKSIYHSSHWWELGNHPFTWGAAAVVMRAAERAHGITKDTK